VISSLSLSFLSIVTFCIGVGLTTVRLAYHSEVEISDTGDQSPRIWLYTLFPGGKMPSALPSIPYDSADLQQRIHAQLSGLTELSTYLASRTSSLTGGPSDSTSIRSQKVVREEDKMVKSAEGDGLGMNRVHLGDEWWADMTEQEMLSFLQRKEMGEFGWSSFGNASANCSFVQPQLDCC
jgi:hypothetical protein